VKVKELVILLMMGVSTGSKRHPNHGCSPIKQHNTFTIACRAASLHREDLCSIFRRPESLMGILLKVDERGYEP
jgi:hypothetical protein